MTLSRRNFTFAAAAMTALPCVASPALAGQRPPRGFAAKAAAALEKARADYAAPGMQVAVMKKGEFVLVSEQGSANLETGAGVTPKSVFRVGSVTKQFTAAAIIKLASTGAIALDAPVSRYLPFMGKLPEMSIEELLWQTAGLHSDESGEVAAATGPRSGLELAEEIAAQKTPLDFAPGSAWLYRYANYIVLGGVVEAVTKSSLKAAIADLITSPLGLGLTAIDASAEIVPDRVSGYTQTGEDDAPYQNAAYIEIAEAGGAGALRSTASDLCKWHDALIANRLFDEKWVAFMTAPGRLRDGRVSGANRFSEEDAVYGDTQYACGLLVTPPDGVNPTVLHYGYIYGFSALLQTWPKQGVTLAVLCNGDVGPALPFRTLREAVVAQLL
jgi:CubicO group peptidase (beta-lactamase class C family)